MIKNFTLTPTLVQWTGIDGQVHQLYRNDNSGRIFFRYKIGTLTDIRHPAIYLGQDLYGRSYFMHNHVQTGRPSIVSEQEFAQGQPYFLDKVSASDSEETLRNGLEQVKAGTPYALLDYNCQTFVNIAVAQTRKSEDVEKWTGALLVAAVIAVGVKFFNQ